VDDVPSDSVCVVAVALETFPDCADVHGRTLLMTDRGPQIHTCSRTAGILIYQLRAFTALARRWAEKPEVNVQTNEIAIPVHPSLRSPLEEHSQL
jgi:hypothetical protein